MTRAEASRSRTSTGEKMVDKLNSRIQNKCVEYRM